MQGSKELFFKPHGTTGFGRGGGAAVMMTRARRVPAWEPAVFGIEILR